MRDLKAVKRSDSIVPLSVVWPQFSPWLHFEIDLGNFNKYQCLGPHTDSHLIGLGVTSDLGFLKVPQVILFVFVFVF